MWQNVPHGLTTVLEGEAARSEHHARFVGVDDLQAEAFHLVTHLWMRLTKKKRFVEYGIKEDFGQAVHDAEQQRVETEGLAAEQPSMKMHEREVRDGTVFRDNIL